MNPDSTSNTGEMVVLGADNSVHTSSAPSHQCAICSKTYASYKSLRKHYRNIHPTELQSLDSLNPRLCKTYQFHCNQCGGNFNRKANFDYHMRKQHSEEPQRLQKKLTCFNCDLQIEKRNYITHLQLEHGIQIETETIQMNSMNEFYAWKEAIQRKTKENFVTERGAQAWGKHNKKINYYFACHRSGFQSNVSVKRKFSKLKGTKKINGFCPASIKLTCEENGKCEVKFSKTHVGHSQDMGRLYLNSSQRKSLATRITAKINNCNFEKDDSALSCEGNNSSSIFVETNENNIIIDQLKRVDVPPNAGIDERKKKLRAKVIKLIENLKSEEEIQVFEKLLVSVQPTISAIHINSSE